MAWFLITLVVVWVLCLVAWTAVSKAFGKSDVNRIKNRLLSGAKSAPERVGKSKDLIQQERQEFATFWL